MPQGRPRSAKRRPAPGPGRTCLAAAGAAGSEALDEADTEGDEGCGDEEGAGPGEMGARR